MPAARRSFSVLIALTLVAGCSEPTRTGSGGVDILEAKGAAVTNPTVTATLPTEAPRDTTLDVQITGSGFDKGSNATFTLGGVLDSRVRVNSTRYVKTTQLTANVTIAADALPELYDVAVVTSAGKKGIGTELFAVTLKGVGLESGIGVLAVNDLGDAVGRGTTLGSCTVTTAPMLWHSDGVPVRLPLGTYCGGDAQAVNHSGVILGSLIGGAANARGLWTPTGSTYTLQEIAPAADGYRPIAGAMNDNNEIVGWRQFVAGLYWWSAATGWVPMQVPAGATACRVAKAINNSGAISGSCSVGGAAYDGYYWPSHTSAPVLLPRPGSGDVNPRAINDAGVIAGFIGTSQTRAVIWLPNGSGYTVSYLPDMGLGSVAYGIASDGTIAGSIETKSNGRNPVLWSPGGGSLSFLELTKPGTGGDANDVALTSTGFVAGGSQSQLGAIRWRSSP
jgi:hypothetical protein